MKLAMLLGLLTVAIGAMAWLPPRFTPISTAEAVVGPPLTPMSYAGVARRTSRRCATGVYYC
jgi:hypothetical protein